MTKNIKITIIDYPNALQSAVFGLKELFSMANKLAIDESLPTEFLTDIIKPSDKMTLIEQSQIVILPPSLDGNYYHSPSEQLLRVLKNAHKSGATLCSGCAGTFILAHTGLLNNRTATTHWQLNEEFCRRFPEVTLKIESLLINDGDIISAGGLMSWIDLGLEIVAQFTKPHIMRSLGKFLIVDTGKREQRYYGSFTPLLNHGDKAILTVQHYLQAHFSQPITMSKLAEIAIMSDRTFLRHFTAATTLKPTQYVQRLRVQKACELLETTTQNFEQISAQVGYDDSNSFRKVFIKIIGLSPSAFRARFV